MKQRLISGAMAACLSLGILIAAISPVSARESRWRHLTYGLGAVTAYGAATHNPGLAVVGAAGTAYSYSRWRRDIRRRHRREWYRRHHRHYRHYRHWHHRHRYYRY